MFLSHLRRHEGWLAFLLVLLLVVIGFVSVQAFLAVPEPILTPTPVPFAQTENNPTLAIYPDRGSAGAYIDVTGTGWPGTTLVTIWLADEAGRSDVLASSTTTVDGALTTGFLYPFEERWQQAGSHTVIAETESGLQVATPLLVNAPTVTVVSTATASSLVTNTVTLTATAAPSATATLLPTDTPVPPAPTETPVPPTDTPLPPPPTETPVPPPVPTDTPVPPPNQPPQVQASLVPVRVNGDRDEGRFQVQVAATDPDNNLQAVVTILRLPLSDQEPRLREAREVEIRFSDRRLEIRGPDPQALFDQIVAYGGVVLQEGQEIDLRIRNRDEEKMELRDDRWRIEAATLEIAVIAVDAAGLNTTVMVSPCSEVDCRVPEENADNSDNNGNNGNNDEDDDND